MLRNSYSRPSTIEDSMATAHSSADGFTRAPNGVGLLTVPAWSGLDWLWHGFSTHRGGVSREYLPEGLRGEASQGQLNLGFTAFDSPENVRENRLRLTEAVTGSRETPLETVRQIHSHRSIVVPPDWVDNHGNHCSHSDEIPEADGIMTNQPGMLLGIQTADCIPVLVADPAQRAVAAFHAGWRGTVTRIVELGVARMGQEFGSDPANLVAAIGPGIGACCYSVGDEVREKFDANFQYAQELLLRSGDSLRLDLVEANRRQLLGAGLSAASIEVVGGCTSCRPELFFSHRASGGHAGRMMAVIGLR